MRHSPIERNIVSLSNDFQNKFADQIRHCSRFRNVIFERIFPYNRSKDRSSFYKIQCLAIAFLFSLFFRKLNRFFNTDSFSFSLFLSSFRWATLMQADATLTKSEPMNVYCNAYSISVTHSTNCVTSLPLALIIFKATMMQIDRIPSFQPFQPALPLITLNLQGAKREEPIGYSVNIPPGVISENRHVENW